jgi:hypothetical protein
MISRGEIAIHSLSNICDLRILGGNLIAELKAHKKIISNFDENMKANLFLSLSEDTCALWTLD